MDKFIKTLNKFNGNICFAGNTDFGYYIFECDYQNKSVSYAPSSKFITDICLETENSYLVAFSSSDLGQYSGGILIESHIPTVIPSIDKIVGNSYSGFYLLNRNLNRLYKMKWGTIWWTLDLPDYSLRYDGKIVFREADDNVIYCNNSNIYTIRDNGVSAVILNSIGVSGSGDLTVAIGNEFRPTYAYVRAGMVSGKELDFSSSSSSSSPSTSSSYSDSSLSSESLSSSSTWLMTSSSSSSSDSSSSSLSSSSSSESSSSSSSSLSSSSSSESSSSSNSSSSSSSSSESSSSSSSSSESSSSSSSNSSSSSSSNSSSSSSRCHCTNPSCTGFNCSNYFSWIFSGMNDRNSDNCMLYAFAAYDIVGGTKKAMVSVYKSTNSIPANLVAYGDSGYQTGPGPYVIILTQQNSSGLSGQVNWAWTTGGDSNPMYLHC